MAATEEQITFQSDGTVTQDVAEMVPVNAPQAPVSVDYDSKEGLERIQAMISDPDAQLSDITRLIALEIAGLLVKSNPDDPLSRGNLSPRDLNEQIKAYRELQKTLTESDQLSKRDTLNMDGPKFRYVFGEIIKLFSKALKEVGLSEDDQKNIMLQFRDFLAANDENMRRDLSKIESGR